MATHLEEKGSVPVPDPTTLTTNAVDKAKAEIEKLFDTKLDKQHTEFVAFRELVKEMFSGRDTALSAALKAAQELVKQQNDSNAVAADKAEKAAAKQIDAIMPRIDDLKERIGELGRKDWATVGAYVVGAIGVAALVASALFHH